MAELLLLNPKGRTVKARKPHRSAAQRRATAKLIALNKARRSGRKSTHRKARASNPLPAVRRVARKARRAVARVTRSRARRRSHNPISLGGVMPMLSEALVGGLGAVGVDVLYGYVNPKLPVSMQNTPGTIGVGTAIKAAATVLLGRVLNRPTRGLSNRIAKGSLIVQVHQAAASVVPASVHMAGVGYASPARLVPVSARVGPNMRAYMPAGTPTPLLNGFMAPGATALLNGSAREREGWGSRR